MVCAELHLESISCMALGPGHDACIVDKNIQSTALDEELLYTFTDTRERAEVELEQFDTAR